MFRRLSGMSGQRNLRCKILAKGLAAGLPTGLILVQKNFNFVLPCLTLFAGVFTLFLPCSNLVFTLLNLVGRWMALKTLEMGASKSPASNSRFLGTNLSPRDRRFEFPLPDGSDAPTLRRCNAPIPLPHGRGSDSLPPAAGIFAVARLQPNDLLGFLDFSTVTIGRL